MRAGHGGHRCPLTPERTVTPPKFPPPTKANATPLLDDRADFSHRFGSQGARCETRWAIECWHTSRGRSAIQEAKHLLQSFFCSQDIAHICILLLALLAWALPCGKRTERVAAGKATATTSAVSAAVDMAMTLVAEALAAEVQAYCFEPDGKPPLPLFLVLSFLL